MTTTKPKKKATQQKENIQKLYVGVDFGTTHSGKVSKYLLGIDAELPGVAFVYSMASDARNIQVITDWGKHETSQKIPTRIAYAFENPGLDEDKIGFDVEPGMKSVSIPVFPGSDGRWGLY